MTNDIYTETPFWNAFRQDLARAKGHVVIQSPFVSNMRIRRMGGEFVSLKEREVAVCAFIQKPKFLDIPRKELSPEQNCTLHEFEANLEILKFWDVHINLIDKIHSKFAVIDHQILWEGSLNILSHVDGLEHMRRTDNRFEATRILETHSLLNCKTCIDAIGLFCPGYPNPSVKALGEGIKRNRIEAGRSLQEMEKQTGIPRKRIGQLERGCGTIGTLYSILENLNLTQLEVPRYMLAAVAQRLVRALNAEKRMMPEPKKAKRSKVLLEMAGSKTDGNTKDG